MPFSETFYHAVVAIDSGEKPLHSVTAKLIETRLHEEIENSGGVSLAVALMPDHAHVLFAAPPEASPDAMITILKENTTELVAGMGRGETFDWKSGYGVVTVSKSHLDIVKGYVETQEERHSSGKINETLEKTE